MALTRRIQTNFSKGELTPLLEGRPDLAAYFEGASEITNWVILRQGGVSRRVGTIFVTEVKNQAQDTILLPMIPSVDLAYILEIGHQYIRFFFDRAPVRVNPTDPPYEIVSPYTESQLRDIHITQSVDVMWLFHEAVQQHRLSHLAPTNWSLLPITYDPPALHEEEPTFNATLTLAATTGLGIAFTLSNNVLLAADVGRYIVYGASKAEIRTITAGGGAGTVDILDAFPDTNPIPAGDWRLKLSPQSELNPTNAHRGIISLTTNIDTFRSTDVGKYIIIYGGLVKITKFISARSIQGDVLSEMSGYDPEDASSPNDPKKAFPGNWELAVPSWSAILGYPRTGEFFQGRLGQAASPQFPTTFWLSESDNYDSYTPGVLASNAVEYAIASRQLNRIEWLADNVDLFIGTNGDEQRARGGRDDAPIGGDQVPLVSKFTNHGSAPIQPINVNNRTIYVDRSRKKIFTIAFNLEEDKFDSVELTGPAEHITGNGIRKGPIATTHRPDPRVYFVREDGKLVSLTYFPQEKVIGFTVYETANGRDSFESVAVIPRPAPLGDQVWVIVKRIIKGQTRRYIEYFEAGV